MARRAARRGRRFRSAKRALHQQLERAIARLGGKPPLRDVSIHAVRKELKRARATLRLLRDAIGETAYRRANQRLRDAARPLSQVRDAKVLYDVVAELRKGTRNAPRRATLVSLERTLQRERRQARRELLQRPGPLRTVRRSVQSVLSDSRSWRDATDESLRCGIERIYRNGRKAFARADEDRSDETLHESRKQTKYLRHALEVAIPTRRGGIARRVKCAESIADALGDHHDLAVLRQRLAARSRSGAAVQELLARIERRGEKLRQSAARRSRHLYEDKAKAFVKRVDRVSGDPGR